MSTISVHLPDSLYEHMRHLAEREKVSVDQLVTLAIAEKMSALDTETYLKERAARARRGDLLRVLDNAPDVPPVEGDEF